VSTQLLTVAHYQSTFIKLTENWIVTQINAAAGVRSIAFAKRIRNQHLLDGIQVYQTSNPLDRVYRRVFGYSRYHARVCIDQNVDILHGWFGYSGVALIRLASRLRIPLVTSFLGADFTRNRAALPKQYSDLATAGSLFLAEGPAAAARLSALGFPGERIRVHRLAIDTRAIKCVERRRSPTEPFHVLMAARFAEKKGWIYGVEAFARFARTADNAFLTIVGAPFSTAEAAIEAQIHDIIERYAITDRVRFVGMVQPNELRGLAEQHHIFLHPSVTASDGDAEGGHPVVFTEMAASGMPIVATHHCDIPEIVAHRQTGWLCAERDVDALAVALHEAWSDPDRSASYGIAGRQLAESKYDIRNNNLSTVYRQLP
jgi:colanic acid/amylovoran biosynthesis glycosyltransferase